MPTDDGWEDIAQDDDGWEDIPAAAPKPKWAQALGGSGMPAKPSPLSWWEKLQQASSGLASQYPDVLKGAAKEVPLMAQRAARMPLDIASGATDLALDATGLGKNETITRARIKQAEDEYKLRRMLESPFEEGADASAGEKFGRGAARVAPQVALGVATSGASLPVQMGLGAAAQGAQSLSEGADPGEAAGAAVLAGGGQLLGPAAQKVLAPGAKLLNRGTLEAAERLGIKLPASALTTSRPVQYVEGAASKMLGGGRVGQRLDEAVEALAGQGDTIQGASDPAIAGSNMADALDRFRKAWGGRTKAAYKQADLSGDTVDPARTLARVDYLLKEGTLEPGALRYLRKLREAIAPVAQAQNPLVGTQAPAAPRSAGDMVSRIRQLQSKGQSYLSQPWAEKNKGLFRELAATLDEDLLAGLDPAKATAYKAAKGVFQEGAKVRESQWAKNITRLAAQGHQDKIASQVFKPSMSAQDIPKIMDTLGPGVADDVRGSVLADLVRQGTRGRQFTPASMENAVKRWGADKLQAILSPEQWQQVQDLTTVSQSMGQAKRIQNGSPTAGLVNVIGMAAAPVNALRTLMGEGMFAKFIGSEAGQRWLTTGSRAAGAAGKAASGAGRGIAASVAEAMRAHNTKQAIR
jgi:hypothetical protein